MNEKSLNPADILTPHELAARLKVKLSWVYESTRGRGRFGGTPLPCLKVGKYIRFNWADVCEWLRSNRGK